MSKTIAIVFNGPPGCGKDTAVDALVSLYNKASVGRGSSAVHKRFKEPLYALLEEYILSEGYDPEEAGIIAYSLAKAEDTKDVPIPYQGQLGVITPRQLLIRLSEDILKPQYGKDVIGKLVASNLMKSQEDFEGGVLAFFSDGGFQEEIECLRDMSIPVLVLQVYRDGCDFSKDSRGYIEGDINIKIHNNGTKEEFVVKSIQSVHKLIGTLAKRIEELTNE